MAIMRLHDSAEYERRQYKRVYYIYIYFVYICQQNPAMLSSHKTWNT